MLITKSKRLLVISLLVLVVLIGFSVGALLFFNKDDVQNTEQDSSEEKTSSIGSDVVIGDYDTDSASDILNKQVDDTEKISELILAALQKRSVGRLDEAVEYYQAVIEVDYSEESNVDAAYNIILIARTDENPELEQEYSEYIGAEKLAELEDGSRYELNEE